MLCGFAGKAFKTPCPASRVFFSKKTNVMKHPGCIKIFLTLLAFFVLGGKCFAEEEKPASVQPPSAQSQQAAPQAEGLSKFEEYVRGLAPGAVSDIRQFGYGLFDEPPSTFAPVEAVPVGPDYVLGPGDELRVSLWGKVNAEYAAAIDRDGKITVPQMGVLQLSGMNFSEANAFLLKELSKYYLPAEVKLNVSMGRLRAIKVFVVGKARRPGSYSISSLSTLINALFAAGGPSKSGSMRNIEVKRAGKTVTSFDMYDFLLKGDKTKDVRLMPE
ncbi:MAG: polysaccharide biosynthesis/export family protein, partial [Deltaproteobacteria bacterium]|nr:polysaccharide biosynthesis/export family protein [Deltaproteobacteria bacterium]